MRKLLLHAFALTLTLAAVTSAEAGNKKQPPNYGEAVSHSKSPQHSGGYARSAYGSGQRHYSAPRRSHHVYGGSGSRVRHSRHGSHVRYY